MIDKEALERAGFTPFKFREEMAGRNVDGWYENEKLFQFGDYWGSVIEEANIAAVVDWMYKHNEPVPSMYYNETDIKMHMENGDFIISYDSGYATQTLLFNMPVIAEKYPDFYTDLLALENDPRLNDSMVTCIAAERVCAAWKDEKLDVLRIAYKRGPDEPYMTYTTWRNAVRKKFPDDGLDCELLNVFIQNGEIEHATGRHVYFRKYDNDDTPSKSLREIIEMTRMFEDPRLKTGIAF